MRKAINPKLLMPIGDRVVVKRYELPEQYGHLVIPRSHAEDFTWTTWEVVRVGLRAQETLGVELHEDDIVTTRGFTPAADTGLYDEADNRDLFILAADQIAKVTRWKEEK